MSEYIFIVALFSLLPSMSQNETGNQFISSDQYVTKIKINETQEEHENEHSQNIIGCG